MRIAIAQLPVTGDARRNGAAVRRAMRAAAEQDVRLLQLPEGLLSGYALNPVEDWAEVDWDVVRAELEEVVALAGELRLWVVLGSAHPLTPPRWPHNSLYVISDEGRLVDRYDKRFVSHTEVTRFYTAGSEPVVLDVDGFRFGCAICIEVNFPEVFVEYAGLGVDCVLLSAYPVDATFAVKARAHAAIHCTWVALATPSDTASFIASALYAPNGDVVDEVEGAEGLLVADLDRSAPELDVALTKAKPWRAMVSADPAYRSGAPDDPRSVDRTTL
ncbi:carbon-nitrogen hydrolase family protein [Nocardioides sp.]|uniref:carbon-nitrogen hydrolase family protein n=1 Tax=Nocardioides sp. TaxID=35761 RepID=UPI0027254109|nr:carbon-nitrogen hydrolase family protein [Nocardioides sp.]MDO9456473.1 carbon-nitrogen hydrolase family protein [Nocardioides sp.]